MRVVLVDTSLGNVHSVMRAVYAASGREITASADPDVVRRADALVVPGQGAFRDCARALGRGLGDAVRERIVAGAPYLGICLGLQILFPSSDEASGCAGLGVFSGHVRRVEPGAGEKVPHTGWNTVETTREGVIDRGAWFYFVHSYAVAPDDDAIVLATTTHGRDRFVSAIAKDNVLAVQFHPEKSQRAGLDLLARFFAGFVA